MIRLIFFAASFVASSTAAVSDELYSYTLEEARKLGQKEDSVFLEEFGDTEGPFRWIASAETTALALPQFKTRIGNGPEISRPKVEGGEARKERFNVLFFVNEKGNSLGVIYRLAAFGETLPELEKEDPRPPAHIALARAANFALFEDNYDLLEQLLESGLAINEPLDPERGDTLLYLAAVIDDQEAVRWLLKWGADREVRSVYGDRPIDVAWKDKQFEICELLRKAEPSEDDPGRREISGFPKDLLVEAFFRESDDRKDLIFLSFNGASPDEEMLAFAQERWPSRKILPVEQMKETTWEVARAKEKNSVYFDADTGEFGNLVQLSLSEKEPEVFEWTYRTASGPALAGGGVEGLVKRAYGYWISEATGYWDE